TSAPTPPPRMSSAAPTNGCTRRSGRGRTGIQRCCHRERCNTAGALASSPAGLAASRRHVNADVSCILFRVTERGRGTPASQPARTPALRRAINSRAMPNRYLIANWKMNIPPEGIAAYLDAVKDADIVVAPPFVYLKEVAAKFADTGAQN